jgi:hypothetical protein
MDGQRLRDRYVGRLMEEMSECRYPSVSMMDRLERAIGDPEVARRYVEALMDHLDQDKYPSPELLDRVDHLISALERRAVREEASNP